MTHNGRRKAPELAALLVFLVAAGSYLALPSSRYNLDGLRNFPALVQVKVENGGQGSGVGGQVEEESGFNTKARSHEDESGEPGLTTTTQRHEGESGTTGALTSYAPRDWRTGYRTPCYSRANVQMHFLFPLYAAADYRLARALGLEPTGVRGLQTANAISAALAVGLFALLVGLLTGSPWTVLATGFGLAFSTAFSSMATNIAEVVPALPWLMLALILLLTDEDMRPARAVCAGLLLGISAAFYFVSAAVGIALAVYLALRRVLRKALLLAGTMAATVSAIYVMVLLLAGYHTLPQLGRALFAISEQGNYGGLKPSNLVSVWLGFAGSVFPVLPDNFGGLRNLLGQTRGPTPAVFFLRVAAIPLAVLLGLAFFAVLFHARRRLEAPARRTVVPGLATFLTALAVSLFWDPYHPKLWVYSNIGLWLMIAGYLAQECRTVPTRQTSRTVRAPVLIGLALFCAVSTNLARRVVDAGANPKWQAAKAVAAIVNAQPGNVVLGGWEDEFDYLTLLVPETNQVSLPDRILEQRCDSTRFAGCMAGTLAAAQDRSGSVYFLNLFKQTPAGLNALYTRRLRFPEIASWLQSLRPQAQEVWSDPATGVALYRLAGQR